MLDIPSISAVIAAASVVVGVFFAILQLRDEVKTRRTGLIIQLNPSLRVSQSEITEAWSKMWNIEYKDYSDFVKKYGDLLSEGPVQSAIGVMSGYFEGMGFLLHRQLIDIDIVDYVAGGTVKMAWEKLKPMFEGFRKEHNMPETMQWFEYLYNEMRRREQRLQQIQQ